MTQHDWIGLLATIAVFIIMIALYVYILHPSNKDRLEAYRHIPFNDENIELSKQIIEEEAHERR